MGKRGPEKKFFSVLEVALTKGQAAHVKHIAVMTGLSQAAVIRSMIQDRLDIAEGRYSPYPEILDADTKSVLAQGE